MLEGGIVHASSVNRMGYEPDKNNFQPRIGFAYKITDKMVLRGGYGMQSTPQSEYPPTTGFSSTTSMVTSVEPGKPYNVLSNPYPDGINSPTGDSLGLATYLGQNVSFYYPTHVTALSHNFSLGIQYEFPYQMVLNVSYVGQRVTTLGNQSHDMNGIPGPQWEELGFSLETMVPNPFEGLLPGTPYNGPMIQQGQLLKPYPQFGSVNELQRTNAKRWYDAAQLSFEKRLSKGLMVMFNYTFGKTIGQNEYLNGAQDRVDQMTKMIIPPDRNHVTNIAASYILPFAANSTGITRQLFYGWNLSTTMTYQSGSPIGPLMGMEWTGVDPKLDNPTSQRYFNTCTLAADGVTRQNCASASEPVAWTIIPPYTLRHTEVFLGVMRPPAQAFKAGINAAFFKQFTITESVRLEFRSEFFNLFNSASFGSGSFGANVDTNPNSPNFGQLSPNQANEPRVGQMSLRLTF